MILLTGFEPFESELGVMLDANPTKAIVGRVSARSAHIESCVLPVSYARTRQAFDGALERIKPVVWIGLGYAPHRTFIDVETIAINMEHSARPDNDGDQANARPIILNAPLA